MAPLDTVLITNTVPRVPLPFIKNRSTPASAVAIPNWLELSLPVQVMVDHPDANVAQPSHWGSDDNSLWHPRFIANGSSFPE